MTNKFRERLPLVFLRALSFPVHKPIIYFIPSLENPYAERNRKCEGVVPFVFAFSSTADEGFERRRKLLVRREAKFATV